MKIDSDELSDYIRAVLQGIGRGISDDIVIGDEPDTFSLSGPVKFRVGIVNSSEVKGEAKIFIAGFHGGKANEQNAQIEFEVSDKGTTLLTTLERLVAMWEKLTDLEKKAVLDSIREFLKVVSDATQVLQSGHVPSVNEGASVPKS